MYKTHGMSKSSAYGSWENMRARCLNPNSPAYQLYGGRGVTICDRWSDFAAFLADMGDRPAGATLDRIDVDGNYEPDNCRWATPRQQALNTRRNVRWTHGGETLTISEWADRLGVNKTTLRMRVSRDGWTVAQALTIKPNPEHRIGRRVFASRASP